MKVTKRNGIVVLFDNEKVSSSILKANAEVRGETITPKTASLIADAVFEKICNLGEVVSTDEIYEFVYTALLVRRFPLTADAYITHARNKRA